MAFMMSLLKKQDGSWSVNLRRIISCLQILQKTNKISALASKSGLIKQIKALYVKWSLININYVLLLIIFCFNHFLEGRAEICKQIVGFLEYLKARKKSSEIY